MKITTQSKPPKAPGPKQPQQDYANDPKRGGYKPSGPARKGD